MYCLFKITVNPSKKLEFSSEKQKYISLCQEGGLKFYFHMTDHIKIAFNLDNQAKLKPVLSDSHS